MSDVPIAICMTAQGEKICYLSLLLYNISILVRFHRTLGDVDLCKS